jgi:hypothetical protein
MVTRLILDEAKYRLFMEENSNWKETIKAHATEIPLWEKMLAAAMDKKEKKNLLHKQKHNSTLPDVSPGAFSGHLLQQHKEMIDLHAAIVAHENRLMLHCETKQEQILESLNTQDMLRNRIKDIEAAYIELKRNFIKYFSTDL